MDRFQGLLGIIVILGIAFLFSNNKKRINFRLVFSGMLLQVIIALLLLKVPVITAFFQTLGKGMKKIEEFSREGVAFVYRGIAIQTGNTTIDFGQGGFVFAFSVTATIILVCVLVAILYHFGIMQFIVSVIAKAMNFIMRVMEAVRRHWYQPWGAAPPHFLSGSHLAANGDIHETARRTGARITHLDLQWNYAAGVHHPDADHPLHGLSLIPPKTALWTNARGERIGPRPLISGFDTRYLVEAVARQPGGYSWQILNRKIALKELGVSGSKYNDALRERNAPAFIANLLFGNRSLYQMLTQRCRDVVLAGTVEELARKMNELAGTQEVDAAALRSALEAYDTALRNRDMDDEQVRRLAQLREYSGDRLRTCNFQPILDPAAGPLMAIREFILTRKTLGGIQTDLRSRVLNEAGQPIQGLYAIGESAGFGGGGIHGRRALEGTFLGNCIFNARVAARSLRSPR